MYPNLMRNKLGQDELQSLYVSKKYFGILTSYYLWHILDSDK